MDHLVHSLINTWSATSLRILHFSSHGESFRVSLRFCYLSSWMVSSLSSCAHGSELTLEQNVQFHNVSNSISRQRKTSPCQLAHHRRILRCESYLCLPFQNLADTELSRIGCSRYASQEELARSRRRSIPHDAHSQTLPELQDQVHCRRSCHDSRSSLLEYSPFATSSMDQLDRSQLG